MAYTQRKFVALCLCACVVTGCASVKVVPNPAEGDKGIRYYRPKPYLLVTPADPTGRLVNMKLEYLPDFNEEYSAHVRGKASIALKDGWNLVGVNTKEAPKDKDEPPAKIEDIKLPPAVVAATNVPLGYYESVYGFNAANGGKKFLQGWRYIGMTVLGGGQPGVCKVAGHNPSCPGGNKDAGCINGPLYGLVFFNGVMTFRQLDEIANNQLCPMFVNPAPAPALPTVAPTGPIRLTPENTEQPIEIRKEANPPVVSPPIPAPTTPPPVVPVPPVSLARPKASPTLAKAAPAPAAAPSRPVATAPALARPTATPVLAGKPVAMPPLGGKVASAPAPVLKKVAATNPAPAPIAPVFRKVAGMTPAPTPAPIAPAVKKVATATATPTIDADPLGGTPPTLDKDLFRTGTSPRP